VKKIGVLTGGGDCPGLNAVIRAVTQTAIKKYGYEVIGYKFGYRGLYLNDFEALTLDRVAGTLPEGGTILFSSNKDNLFNYYIEEEDVYRDVSDIAVENLNKENVDALVVIGGDGTLTSARDFARKGINVIGVPKTIDNDLPETDITFGFNSAYNVVSEALGRLRTTAKSHHRVMILEVMGRHTGWIALAGGIAGSASAIIIPEIEYDINKVVEVIEKREYRGKLFTLIVVAEGAKAVDGIISVKKKVTDSPDSIRLGGAGEKIASELEKLLPEKEIRCTVLGHLQRGGDTSPFDRILSTRYGVGAIDYIHKKKFGNMVCIKKNELTYASLEDVIGRGKTGETQKGGSKTVNLNDEMVRTARSIEICLGD